MRIFKMSVMSRPIWSDSLVWMTGADLVRIGIGQCRKVMCLYCYSQYYSFQWCCSNKILCHICSKWPPDRKKGSKRRGQIRGTVFPLTNRNCTDTGNCRFPPLPSLTFIFAQPFDISAASAVKPHSAGLQWVPRGPMAAVNVGRLTKTNESIHPSILWSC